MDAGSLELLTVELAKLVDVAKRRDAILPPSGAAVIEIRLDGAPSHLMSNAVAAFQREIEDVFLRRTSIIGGGYGCLVVQFDLGDMTAEAESRISRFFQDQANLTYFQARYGINSATVRRLTRYS